MPSSENEGNEMDGSENEGNEMHGGENEETEGRKIKVMGPKVVGGGSG